MTVRWDIIPAGERKVESLDAGAADAGLRPHALAGPDADESQCRLRPGFLRGRLFSSAAGLVVAAGDPVRLRPGH